MRKATCALGDDVMKLRILEEGERRCEEKKRVFVQYLRKGPFIKFFPLSVQIILNPVLLSLASSPSESFALKGLSRYWRPQ